MTFMCTVLKMFRKTFRSAYYFLCNHSKLGPFHAFALYSSLIRSLTSTCVLYYIYCKILSPVPLISSSISRRLVSFFKPVTAQLLNNILLLTLTLAMEEFCCTNRLLSRKE